MPAPRRPHRWPLSVPPVKPKPRAAVRADPYPDSPISLRFRDEIARRESQVNGYRAYNPAGGATGAFGRYQMRKDALIDAGLLDRAGRWTGAMGVKSAADFLADPRAQEEAFAAYMRKNRERLSIDPVGHRNIGQRVFSKDGDFTITEGGLMAAAHRQGAGALRSYLAHVRDRAWVSKPAAVGGKEGQAYVRIENRLREFQNVPYSKPLPFPPPLPPAKLGRGR